MSDFVLVNLSQQQEKVISHVKGWTIDEVINWMKQYGNVIVSKENQGIYVFESNFGFEDAFHFDENGNLVVISSGWLA